MPHSDRFHINLSLVRQLIATQFPQWADLTITPVKESGWDNATFRLGEHMTVRLPNAVRYCPQVQKEHRWLPKLAPHLPLAIPTPLAMGNPTEEYPCHWSVYQWLDGETVSIERITDLRQFAIALADFLRALHRIDTTGGPAAGPHNFYRGGELKTYDAQTRNAIKILGNTIDANAATAVWDTALESAWNKHPVWVHGDIAAGNLLVKDGKLSAVIDFGCLGIGDPACDLAITWTLFEGESRDAFRATLELDDDIWARGRGWALWKALITCTAPSGAHNLDVEKSKHVINEIVAEYKGKSQSNPG